MAALAKIRMFTALLPADGINEWNPPKSGFYWQMYDVKSFSLFLWAWDILWYVRAPAFHLCSIFVYMSVLSFGCWCCLVILFCLLGEVFSFLVFFEYIRLMVKKIMQNECSYFGVWLDNIPKAIWRGPVFYSMNHFLKSIDLCCCWEEGEYLETNDHNQLLRSALMGVGSFKVPFPQKGVRKMKQPEKEAGFQRKVICFYF